MAPSVEKLAQTGVFFTVTSLPMVMNVHADAENPLWRAALAHGRRQPCVGATYVAFSVGGKGLTFSLRYTVPCDNTAIVRAGKRFTTTACSVLTATSTNMSCRTSSSCYGCSCWSSRFTLGSGRHRRRASFEATLASLSPACAAASSAALCSEESWPTIDARISAFCSSCCAYLTPVARATTRLLALGCGAMPPSAGGAMGSAKSSSAGSSTAGGWVAAKRMLAQNKSIWCGDLATY